MLELEEVAQEAEVLQVVEDLVHIVVTIMEEDSGLHFLLKLKMELSDKEFMQRALQKGVKLNSLSAYYHDSPDDFAAHTFIINYSYLNTEHLAEAINVLYDCIKK